MTMTPDAKSELSKTIRKIRECLLIDLHDANERAFQLGLPIDKTKLNEEATIRRQRMEAWINEQIRAETGDEKRDAMSFHRDIEKQAAYTYLNRIVILRFMEAWDLRGQARPACAFMPCLLRTLDSGNRTSMWRCKLLTRVLRMLKLVFLGKHGIEVK